MVASPRANLFMANFASHALVFRPTTANVAKGFAVFERGENGAILGRRASAPGHYDASRHAVVDTDKLIIIFITFFIIYIFQRLSLRLPFLRILRRPVAYWPSLPKLPCRQTRTPSRCDARYNMLYKYYINHSNDILFNKARRSAVLPRNFQSLKTPYTEDSRSLTLRGSGEHESPQKRRGVFSKGK